MDDRQLETLLGRRDHGRQRHFAIRKLGGERITHCRASARRGEEAGHVETDLLEVPLVPGDRVGHAVHAGAEMGDIELDRPGGGRQGECESGRKTEFHPHDLLRLLGLAAFVARSHQFRVSM